MQFYSVKHRAWISAPPESLRKRRLTRPRVRPCGARYAAVATVLVDGSPLRVTRFLTREAFDSLDVPEVS
jgi:hypothetical protein